MSNQSVRMSMPAEDSWQAELQLGFAQKSGRSVLTKRRSVGPLMVQRPFYPADDVCHVYLLHPPGGVVGGDMLTTKVEVDDAQALITTPGASKLYRSQDRYSVQKNILSIDQGSLEWFPQECIAFSGTHAVSNTKVSLGRHARFIGWEILCLGRPAANEVFERGQVLMRFDIWRENKPVLLDRLQLKGADALLTSSWGLSGYSCSATFIAVGVDQKLFTHLREAVTTQHDDILSFTLIEDLLLCRYLGHQAERAKHTFIRLWHQLREALIARPVVEPRIWNT